jgi:hypothetical protein
MKRSVFYVGECSECKAKWQTPGMLDFNGTTLQILHKECPKCHNSKDTLFDVRNDYKEKV